MSWKIADNCPGNVKVILIPFLGAAQNSSMSNFTNELSSSTASSTGSYISSKTKSDSIDMTSTTAIYSARKNETVTSTITTSITSSYTSSPLPTLISSSSDSILTSSSVAVTSSMNNSNVMVTTNVPVVSSVTPTSVFSLENVTSSNASLAITPSLTQTVVAPNITPSSSLTNKSVPINITSSANEPSTLLTQTYNVTQSTPVDSVTMTKIISIISTSTTKVESKILFLLWMYVSTVTGLKDLNVSKNFIKVVKKSKFHRRFFQHFYFKIDRKGPMFPIPWKSVNWFAMQISWLVSKWWETLFINGLTHFRPMLHFSAPWKQKWEGLLMFSGSIGKGILTRNGLMVMLYNAKQFVPNALFLYPLKTLENLTVFWCFQGVEKECIGNDLVT